MHSISYIRGLAQRKNSTLNPKAQVAVVNEAASFYDPLNFRAQTSRCVVVPE